MKNMIMSVPGQCSWVTYIKKRIDNNLNFIAVATGPTGIGKTLTMIKKGSEIDPDFDPIQQVAFDFRGIMRIINNFNDPENLLSKRKYKVAIFDEPQISISNREWQSKANKLFNYLLSTFRHQNIILLFATPYIDFIDSSSQKLLHSEWKCRGYNPAKKKGYVRPVLLQYYPPKKKYYQHSLYVLRDGRVNKYTSMAINECPKELVSSYEKMKLEFTSKLNKRIERELNTYENHGEAPDIDIAKGRKAMTDKQLQVMRLFAEIGNAQAIATILNITPRSVWQHKASAEKKGYRVSEFYTVDQVEKAKNQKSKKM